METFSDSIDSPIGFNDYFITAYYSHDFGHRKPHVESYIKLLEDAGLKASETLFIDDTAVNIDGAKEAGLKTIHLKPPMTVFDLKLY